MAFEVRLSDSASEFVNSLLEPDRFLLGSAFQWLSANPFADGFLKTDLPFPFRPGCIGTTVGDFWIGYTVKGATIHVLFVDWDPKSGKHWRNCS